jgi:hypothetical protein
MSEGGTRASFNTFVSFCAFCPVRQRSIPVSCFPDSKESVPTCVNPWLKISEHGDWEICRLRLARFPTRSRPPRGFTFYLADAISSIAQISAD